MEIGRQARTHPLQGQQMIQAIPVQGHCDAHHGQYHHPQKPASPPESGQHLKRQTRLPSADLARLSDAANSEAVIPGSEVGIMHRLVIRGLAPTGVRALQPVLVAKTLADIEVQGAEFDFQIVMSRRQIHAGHHSFSRLRNRIGVASDAQCANERGRRVARLVRFGLVACETIERSEPDTALAIVEQELRLPRRKTARRGEVAQGSGLGI
jgi:hypothetical protein